MAGDRAAGGLLILGCVASLVACSFTGASKGDAAGPLREEPSATSWSTGASAPAPTPTSRAWDPAYVPSPIVSDDPCLATMPEGEVVELGISPQLLSELTFDPWQTGMLRPLIEGPDAVLYPVAGYDLNWSYAIEDEAQCDSLARFGRVLGFTREAWPIDDSNDPEPPLPYVQSSVDLFQTAAGVSDYVQWLVEAGPAPADSAEGGAWRIGQSTTGSNRTLFWAGKRGDESVLATLIQEGRFLGRLLAVLPADTQMTIDMGSWAQQVRKLLASARPVSTEHDVARVLAAPLPLSAWGPEYQEFEPDWNTELVDYGPGGLSFERSYSDSLEPLMPAVVRVSTTIDFLPDGGAEKAVASSASSLAGSPEALAFELPAIEGASGYRVWSTDGGLLADEWEDGYSWVAVFAQGPVAATVRLEFGGSTPDAQRHDRAKVVEVAGLLADHLARVLAHPRLATADSSPARAPITSATPIE